MSRLPDPPAIHPSLYLAGAKSRADDLAEVIDFIRVEADLPSLADAVSFQGDELVKLVEVSIDNDAGGENVVPHLIASLDALLFDARVLQERLRRH